MSVGEHCKGFKKVNKQGNLSPNSEMMHTVPGRNERPNENTCFDFDTPFNSSASSEPDSSLDFKGSSFKIPDQPRLELLTQLPPNPECSTPDETA
jgi:hypothetical protein